MTDQTLYLILYGLGGIVAAIVGYQVWWHIKYEKVRSEIKDDKGIVTDMDYTASSTSTTYNATTKTVSTSTTPARFDVYIKFENIGERSFNDEHLYETVRMDDDVTAQYVEVWKVEKQNPRNRELMRYETLTVTSPKGRKINLQ